MTEIVCDSMSALEVIGDGRGARIVLRTPGGSVDLLLPSECLHRLLMTLPRAISVAMQARHKNDKLRLVFPLEDWLLETTGNIQEQLILRLATTSGFSVAFAVSHNDLAGMFVSAEAELKKSTAAEHAIELRTSTRARFPRTAFRPLHRGTDETDRRQSHPGSAGGRVGRAQRSGGAEAGHSRV